jgi:2-methylcitrate dehydratase PrpD
VLRRTVDHYLGSHHRPLGDEQVLAKFRQLAARTLPAQAVAAIERGVLQLEHSASVAALVQALY